MPPKKSTPAKAKASSTDSSATDNTVGGVVMKAEDLVFIHQCLAHLIGGGSITIDCAAVAALRGQANPRSVANRLSNIRKTYSLPFVAGNTSGTAVAASEAADDASDNEEIASSPPKKTPAKRAVSGTKRKAATPRKTPGKRVASSKKGKVVKGEEDAEAEAAEGLEAIAEADDGGEDAAEASDEIKAEAQESSQDKRKDSQDSTGSAASGSGFTPINGPATVASEGSQEFYEPA